MKKIEDYILLSKEVRQAHLKLNESCLERGGQSQYLKGLLAHILGTTIPSGHKIHVCHACHNASCSNPNHLYWGTASENSLDRMDNNGLNVFEKMVVKHGLEEAKRIQRRNANPSKAGKGNTGKKKSEEHKRKIAEAIKRKHAQRIERSGGGTGRHA